MWRTEKGFTLIEVLVAMVILGFGLLELGRMQTTALQAQAAAQRLTRGSTVAQDRLERLMALPADDPSLADLTPVGTFTNYTDANPAPGYSVAWQVDANAPSTGTMTINVTVTWKNLRTPKTFTLSSYKRIT